MGVRSYKQIFNFMGVNASIPSCSRVNRTLIYSYCISKSNAGDNVPYTESNPNFLDPFLRAGGNTTPERRSPSRPSTGNNQAGFSIPQETFKWGVWWAGFFCMALWFSSVKMKWDDLCFPSSVSISYLVSLSNKLVGPVKIPRYSHIIF